MLGKAWGFMRLYVYKDNETWGPYPIEEIQVLLQEGRVTPSDLAQEENTNSEEWLPLDEFAEVQALLPWLDWAFATVVNEIAS